MIPNKKYKHLKVVINDMHVSGKDFIVYWFGPQQVEKNPLIFLWIPREFLFYV